MTNGQAPRRGCRAWAALLPPMVVAWCSLVPGDALAQEPAAGDTGIFQRYNVSNGLANNVAFDVAEDKYGFVWTTTRNGISKFDGSDFTTYRPVPPGVQGQVAQFYQTIFPARDGNLWFCSWGNGLLKLDIQTERFTFYRHDAANPASIAGDEVWFAFEDKDGMMWISSLGGLSRLDPATGQAKVYRHDPANPNSLGHNLPTQVVQDKTGALWIGTYGGGLDRLDTASQSFTHYRHDDADANSLSNDWIEGVFLDRDGTLWIATDGGLNHFDPHGPPRFKSFKHDPNDPFSLSSDVVLQVSRDSRGRLWTTNWGGGIHRFDEGTGHFIPYSYDPANPLGPSTNLSEYFREAHDGTLWFASFNGLNHYDEAGARFQLILQQHGLPGVRGDMAVSGAHQDGQGRLWVSSDDMSLLRVDHGGGGVRRYRQKAGDPRSLSNDSGTAVTMDADGAIWVGTRGGLNRYDAASDTFERFTVAANGPQGMASDNISDLSADRHGNLWLTMYGVGLQRFDPRHKTFTLFHHDAGDPHSLANDQTNAVRVTTDGSVWVGSDAGLSRLDPASGRFTNFSAEHDGLTSVIVNAIAEGAQGRVLVGTDVGVNVFDPRTGAFTSYTVRQGMPSNYVMALESDLAGNIWAATDKGLVRIDSSSGKVRVYDSNDGLPSNQFWNHAAYRAPDGTLYFGSTNGLTSFQPARLHDSPEPPPVYITEFSLFKHKVSPGPDSPLRVAVQLTRAITLDYSQSSLGFRFAALNYRWSLKNRYAYKLEGFDADWVSADSSSRQAVYTNLAPGHYVFRVKASNNDGVWNEAGASLAITITPPWWQTWWFRLVVLLAFTTLAYAAYRARVQQLRKQTHALQRLVAERTQDLSAAKDAAEVANQAKSTFLSSMSHELRTPLNAILGYTQLLIKQDNLTTRQREQLAVMGASGEHLLTLISDILDLSKIEAQKLELVEASFCLPRLLDQVLEITRIKAEQKGLALAHDTFANLPEWVRGDERRIRQILLNLLANAVKFTQSGAVTLRAEYDAAHALLQCEVVDTGIGIREDKLDTIFEPFSQITPLGEGREGAGLGLTITRRLATMMGGEVDVKSRPGHGSTFRFSVPVPSVVAGEQFARPTGHDIRGYTGERRRVLVVDDNPVNATLLADLLNPLGFQVRTAASGSQALAMALAEPPHLVLQDLVMPEHDGLDTLREMRRHRQLDATRIIGVSASITGSERRHAFVAECDGFLNKPVQVPEMLQMIGRSLGIEWERDPPESAGQAAGSSDLGPAELPPSDLLHELRRIANRGAFGELELLLKQHAQDPVYAAFCRNVRRLAVRYDDDGIVAYLDLLETARAEGRTG
ncbi:MAG: two-component regulator propeller domain-containing protein [Vitreoscilla sp.]